MIESQAGENFTAKFEALVTRCMWELPKKERELEAIQDMIASERKQLRYIREKKQKLQNNLTSLEYKSAMLLQELNKAVQELEGT